MAFAILNLKHRQNENIKKAPVGFSWTVFFFGCFPAVFRGDWKWFLIMAILQMVTFRTSHEALSNHLQLQEQILVKGHMMESSQDF